MPESQGFQPTVIVDGLDPETRDRVIRVNAPGTNSETRLSETGHVSLNVTGATGIGTSGEPQALEVLRQRLEADGHLVTVDRREERDSWGEDATIGVDGRSYIGQIVTAVGAPSFWRDAKMGSALTVVQAHGAVDWIRQSLKAKAGGIPSTQRTVTILGIDSRHAGALSDPIIRDGYLNTYGCPAREFGFSSVYIVGPIARFCERLGNGSP